MVVASSYAVNKAFSMMTLVRLQIIFSD